MQVNIDVGEEIIKTNNKKLLEEVIKQVEKKRKCIQEYSLLVNLIITRYQENKKSLEQEIIYLKNKEEKIDKELTEINKKEIDLKNEEIKIKDQLNELRLVLEQLRLHKLKCEKTYNTFYAIPFLSKRLKKKYLKARDKSFSLEQQVSEMRALLDNCKENLNTISKLIFNQNLEQNQINNERRGSINKINNTNNDIDFLKKSTEFWDGFDSYQAKVLLESAYYLFNIKTGAKKKSKNTLDINEVWIKTFLLSCFEYGEREGYGDQKYSLSNSTIQVHFACFLCKTAKFDWPRLLVNKSELVCDSCFHSQDNSSFISFHHIKMKKIVHNLFNTKSVAPISE